MMQKNKELIRKRTSRVTFFLISILLCVFTFLVTAQVTVLNLSYLRNRIIKSEYAVALNSEIKKSIVLSSGSSGFTDKEITAVLKDNVVLGDVMVKAMKIYNYDITDVNIESFKENMYNSLKSDLEEKNITIDSAVENKINYWVNVSAEIYEQKLTIPLSSSLSAAIEKYDYIPYLQIAVIFTLIYLITFLILINKSIKNRLKYFSYSLFLASLLILVSIIILTSLYQINYDNISSEAFKDLAISYYNGIINIIAIIGCISAIVGGIAIVAYYNRKSKNKRQNLYYSSKLNTRIFDYENN